MPVSVRAAMPRLRCQALRYAAYCCRRYAAIIDDAAIERCLAPALLCYCLRRVRCAALLADASIYATMSACHAITIERRRHDCHIITFTPFIYWHADVRRRDARGALPLRAIAEYYLLCCFIFYATIAS